ncbi:hypothetical protein BBJ28_00021532, partial [Nothophytophthora sp. Chile5]
EKREATKRQFIEKRSLAARARSPRSPSSMNEIIQLGLALEMEHVNASFLVPPNADGGSSPTSSASRADSLPVASCASPHGNLELLGVGAAHPHLLGLGLQYTGGHAPITATNQLPMTPQQRLEVDGGEQLPELIEERLRNLLGEPLSDVDRANVQLAPLRSCLPGEIVAVEDSSGTLRYGKVRGEDEDPSNNAEVKVQVSKACIRWYAVSQIYFFQSVASRNNNTNSEEWTGRLPASTVKRQKDLGSATDASAFSVIAAVNALLARLNVSLSTSYEELLAEILRLQHRSALAEEDRRAALKQLEHALREKRDAQKALVCVVCLMNSVDRVLVPCGHSYCATCVQRLQQGSCPVCRQEISDSAVFRVP